MRGKVKPLNTKINPATSPEGFPRARPDETNRYDPKNATNNDKMYSKFIKFAVPRIGARSMIGLRAPYSRLKRNGNPKKFQGLHSNCCKENELTALT